MPSFVDYYPVQCLLAISKRHLDSLDRSRAANGRIIGQDNFDNLSVSTVFASIAIEAALNEYILIHCLFFDNTYLQEFYKSVIQEFLRSPIHKKLSILTERWPEEIPKDLLKDVREIIRIRNRIAHQSGEIRTANANPDKQAVMSNRPLNQTEMSHMLRHYEIAHDFLSRFWYPGNRELQS